MTVICDLSDLPVDQCACRLHAPKAVPLGVETVGQPFPAHYPGECARCGSPIVEGDQIARAADRSGYVHADERECTRA